MASDPPKMKSLFGGAPAGGFFDLPRGSAYVSDLPDNALIGAPAATPYAGAGNYCADAPDAVRAAFGWPGVLRHYDFDIGGRLLPSGVSAQARTRPRWPSRVWWRLPRSTSQTFSGPSREAETTVFPLDVSAQA